MEYLVKLVGGYDSTGFSILLISSILGGAILAKLSRNTILNAIGVMLPIFGVALIISLLTNTVDTTPNLPSYANYIPIVFVVVLIAGIFTGMHKHTANRDRESSANSPTQSTKH